MATSLHPQEIYLLEQYTSLAYFGEMRDAWEKMLNVAEQALEEFMHKLPADYRNRALPEQPDITWGQRVLPNFRDTMNGLNEAYIRISHGDAKELGWANSVSNDANATRRDYYPSWMTGPQSVEVYKWLGEATSYAGNIIKSVGCGWNMNSLRRETSREYQYSKIQSFPAVWPSYQLNPKYRGKTEEKVPKTGIYLPEIDESCAVFHIEGEEFYTAEVGINPETHHSAREEPTTWTLVERVSDTSGISVIPSLTGQDRLRCEGGKLCPKAGYWITPAQVNSRRHFKQDELMPVVEGSAYGATIWQWDVDQSTLES
jgi:hypothetical protein